MFSAVPARSQKKKPLYLVTRAIGNVLEFEARRLSLCPTWRPNSAEPRCFSLNPLAVSILATHLIREIRGRLKKISLFANLARLQSVPGEPPSSYCVDQG
jgi:hypothetical protein